MIPAPSPPPLRLSYDGYATVRATIIIMMSFTWNEGRMVLSKVNHIVDRWVRIP